MHKNRTLASRSHVTPIAALLLGLAGCNGSIGTGGELPTLDSTSTDAPAALAQATQPVVWTHLVNATASGGSLSKTGGCDGCYDAGAVSTQQIAAGDGYVEFVAADAQRDRCLGVSRGDPGTWCGNMPFALRLQAGIAEVREWGSWRADTRFSAGDTFRVAVEGGRVRYYRNGVAFYTSAAAPAYPIIAAATLMGAGSTITSARITSGADTTRPALANLAAAPTADGAVITWNTDEPADGQIQFGPTAAYGRFTDRDPVRVTSHRLAITGLAPGTYHFRVWTADAAWNYTVSPDATFTVGAAQQPPPVPQGGALHHRCAWMFSHEASLTSNFAAHATYFDAIHPVWYALQSDGVNIRNVAGEGDATVIAAAKKAGTALIPTVASVDDTSYTRKLIYSPANRAAHIKLLVNLAVSKGYAGLDLDYEHLWDNADAAPIAAFIQEFSAAMHAAGKVADFAAPALSGPSSVWNYTQLAANLDTVHIMGYDYHTVGTHAGPTSPLGWIDQIDAWAEKTGHPEKFMLGIPNYGVTASSMCALADCPNRCTSSIQTSSSHMLSCSYGTISTPERILNCNSNEGALFFDDVASLEQKVQNARAHRLAGIAYWQLGGEPNGLLDMVRKYY